MELAQYCLPVAGFCRLIIDVESLSFVSSESFEELRNET
jgi:hypothetical protein